MLLVICGDSDVGVLSVQDDFTGFSLVEILKEYRSLVRSVGRREADSYQMEGDKTVQNANEGTCGSYQVGTN